MKHFTIIAAVVTGSLVFWAMRVDEPSDTNPRCIEAGRIDAEIKVCRRTYGCEVTHEQLLSRATGRKFCSNTDLFHDAPAVDPDRNGGGPL